MTKSDDILLTSLEKKRNIEGKLRYYYGNSQITAATTVMYKDLSFVGIIGVHTRCEPQDKKNTIKIEHNIAFLPKSRYYVLDSAFQEIVGESEVLKKALYRAQKASKTSSSVLIRGKSGTRKELVAKAIHRNSKRSNKPFITVNCGAIHSNLLGSELFGHEQGSFTGAVTRKVGKFEQAKEGTIFLDEVGDLSLCMQVKLLRVL